MIRLLNFWRLRSHVEDGMRVEFYMTVFGNMVITRIEEV